MEPVFPSSGKTSGRGPASSDGSQKSLLTELWEVIRTVGIAFIVLLLLNIYVFNLSVVKGQSMEPTLEESERLFVNKIIYDFRDPQPGEVVVLKDPSDGPDKKEYLVKRVIAGPGDIVEARDRELYVNSIALNEPYTDIRIEDADFGPVVLESDEYFVMGDNRHAGRSKDSRYFGNVKKNQITGRAEFVFWPLTKIRGL
ncbi:signal peptidase I [Paenibacillus sp. YPG26]|uniref:signal peptidase I n=1 Tax=Paenibacillus sp. YPG26 TaxID=2878915 RepID=UPI00203DAD24|nr:signal peptidase I [Paenibacillus sp. YPG26]USB33827.1 signal peptidase I [Paenibacillus sp. YPG26]